MQIYRKKIKKVTLKDNYKKVIFAVGLESKFQSNKSLELDTSNYKSIYQKTVKVSNKSIFWHKECKVNNDCYYKSFKMNL